MLVIVLLMMTVDEIHCWQIPEEIQALKRRRLYRLHETGITWKSAHDATSQMISDSNAMEDLRRKQMELEKKIEFLREEQTRIKIKIKELLEHLHETEMVQRWRRFLL